MTTDEIPTVEMEGVLGEDYFRVRKVLYDSYVWV